MTRNDTVNFSTIQVRRDLVPKLRTLKRALMAEQDREMNTADVIDVLYAEYTHNHQRESESAVA